MRIAVEAEAESRRSRGFERILPSLRHNPFAKWMDSARYANLLVQRVLKTKHARRERAEEKEKENARQSELDALLDGAPLL